ncbi:MAG TPA: protein kinase [Polyangiaceae bacterium]|jgi:serine/threonine-protein kinase|nr:protein kinase [Polyangiaceae bacterium]
MRAIRTRSGVGLIRKSTLRLEPPAAVSPSLESEVAYEIGRHTLVAELARGGMGVIHLAVSRSAGGFDNLFAIKQLKPEYARDENYVAMFLEEARLAAHLTHPNIVQTHEVGSSGQRHYIVMDYLDGRSLHDIVRHMSSLGGLPIGAHLRVIAEALVGLHYAHEARGLDDMPLNIVHRDFSPLNVFVTVDGEVKLIDFGIAKAVDSSVDTRTGVLKGRLAYMAPEQAWGGEVDRRADIYAAGVMLWEAATGRRLWPGMSDLEILARLSREGTPRLRSARPDAPAALVAICERAMAQECDERYATAAELVADLEAHILSRDDQMTARETGALVSREFAVELRQVNAAIAEALTNVHSASRPAPMQRFSFMASSGSHARIVHEDLSRYWMHPWSRSERRSPALPAAPPLLAVPSLSARASPEPAFSSAISSVPSEHETKRAVRARRSAGAATLGVGASLFLVALLVSLLREGFARSSAAHSSIARPAPVTASRPGQDSPTGSAGAPSPELIEVAIRVSPAAAQLVVDGADVAGNPFFARYPKDERQVHHVLAFADGFEPKWRSVTFGAAVAMDLTLERHASSALSGNAPASPLVQPIHASSPAAVRVSVRAPRPAAPELWRVFPTDLPAQR